MWGSDYPHDEGTWPYTREHLRARFHDVPEKELREILAGNVAASTTSTSTRSRRSPRSSARRSTRSRSRSTRCPTRSSQRLSDGHGPQGDQVSELVLVDEPAPHVRRITLNRPEKRNALNHPLRGELIEQLQAADVDDDVHVIDRPRRRHVLLGRLRPRRRQRGPRLCRYFTAGGEGQWPRHVTEGWMSIWDLAKPVIAQVHGYCLAGGSELATGCDLVYVAEDAKMGYPAVRFGVPDMQFHAWFLGMRAAMEMMVTGDSISGVEAVRLGWANRAFPADELDDEVVEIASASR